MIKNSSKSSMQDIKGTSSMQDFQTFAKASEKEQTSKLDTSKMDSKNTEPEFFQND